jgi:hypothetical protein
VSDASIQALPDIDHSLDGNVAINPWSEQASGVEPLGPSMTNSYQHGTMFGGFDCNGGNTVEVVTRLNLVQDFSPDFLNWYPEMPTGSPMYNSQPTGGSCLSFGAQGMFRQAQDWDLMGGSPGLPDFQPNHTSTLVSNMTIGLPDPSPAIPTAPVTAIAGFPCSHLGCTKSFKRDYERTRHESSVHGINQGIHLCPVTGCEKGHGGGFSRADKVKEHLWKKHADLGYTKRVL